MPELPFQSVQLLDEPWFPYLCTEAEGWRWQAIIQGHFNLWVVLDGNGFLWCDNKPYALNPGSCFVFCPGQTVRATHTPGKRITRLAAHFVPVLDQQSHLNPDPQTALTQLPATIQGLPILGAALPDPGETRARCELICGRDPSLSIGQSVEPGTKARHAFALINQIHHTAQSGLDTPLDPAVASSIEAMEADPSLNVKTDQLAQQAGLSRSHFDRLFTEQVGTPPKQFLIRLRIARAQQMLGQSQTTIGDIAKLLGYQDVYFFSRQFKQTTGITPTAYRRATTLTPTTTNTTNTNTSSAAHKKSRNR